MGSASLAAARQPALTATTRRAEGKKALQTHRDRQTDKAFYRATCRSLKKKKRKKKKKKDTREKIYTRSLTFDEYVGPIPFLVVPILKKKKKCIEI